MIVASISLHIITLPKNSNVFTDIFYKMFLYLFIIGLNNKKQVKNYVF